MLLESVPGLDVVDCRESGDRICVGSVEDDDGDPCLQYTLFILVNVGASLVTSCSCYFVFVTAITVISHRTEQLLLKL